jgi:hypothetical protein
MRAFVRVESGCVMTLDIDETSLVGALKHAIEQSRQTAVPAVSQRLLLGAEELEDGRQLCSYAEPAEKRSLHLVLCAAPAEGARVEAPSLLLLAPPCAYTAAAPAPLALDGALEVELLLPAAQLARLRGTAVPAALAAAAALVGGDEREEAELAVLAGVLLAAFDVRAHKDQPCEFTLAALQVEAVAAEAAGGAEMATSGESAAAALSRVRLRFSPGAGRLWACATSHCVLLDLGAVSRAEVVGAAGGGGGGGGGARAPSPPGMPCAAAVGPAQHAPPRACDAAVAFRTASPAPVRLVVRERHGRGGGTKLLTLGRGGDGLASELRARVGARFGCHAAHVANMQLPLDPAGEVGAREGMICDGDLLRVAADSLVLFEMLQGEAAQAAEQEAQLVLDRAREAAPQLTTEEYREQHWVNARAGFYAVVGKMEADEEHQLLLAVVQAFCADEDGSGGGGSSAGGA